MPNVNGMVDQLNEVIEFQSVYQYRLTLITKIRKEPLNVVAVGQVTPVPNRTGQ